MLFRSILTAALFLSKEKKWDLDDDACCQGNISFRLMFKNNVVEKLGPEEKKVNEFRVLLHCYVQGLSL
jgi:hypothetical protein